MMTHRALPALALFAALSTTFAEVHPFCDQIVQDGDDAVDKARRGPDGRAACARHVATYSLTQYAAALVVTSVAGYRIPTGALLAGTAINAVTHYAIDRREPLKRVLGQRKAGYLKYACVVRPGYPSGTILDDGGPGTALMELDQAAHRVIGVAAALVTTWLAVRTRR